MSQKKKRQKRRKASGTPRKPGALQRKRLNKMSMGCLVLLLLLVGFLVVPRLLSGMTP